MPITDFLGKIIGGSVGDAFQKIVGAFKADPTQVMQAQTELAKIQLELQSKIQDAVSNEITQAGEIIKAEAQSQSWLPRNVRPLLLLLWGVSITLHALGLTAYINHWSGLQIPAQLDPWVYKLTAIGFTGYVTARTWEKVKDADN